MPDDLLSALVAHLRPIERRSQSRTVYYIDCPHCGALDRERKCNIYFNPRHDAWEYHCYRCGESGGLKKLARLNGLEDGAAYTAPQRQERKPEPPPAWLLHPPEYPPADARARKIIRQYAPLPDWMIDRQRITVGVLPPGRDGRRYCEHERIIVPIYDNGLFVGVRGRRIDSIAPFRIVRGADGHPEKQYVHRSWHAPGGTKIERYPLYNAENVPPGAVVFITENPIDALLIEIYTHGAAYGVATFSVSYWQPKWTESLRALNPRAIKVAYDNDLAGNGGGKHRPALIRAWVAKQRDKMRREGRTWKIKIPPALGPRLANQLHEAGLRQTTLLDWRDAPPKADVRSLLDGKF